MRIEIRDIESSMVYDIGANGAILGRESAKSDITIRDDAISKRHARIFADGGGWFLEDLGSSNGTFVDNRRIKDPVSLSKGQEFSLSQRGFQVVSLESGSGTDDVDPNDPMWFSNSLSGVSDETAGEVDQGGAPVSSERGGTFADDDDAFDHTGDADGADDEVEEKGFGDIAAAVPKAIAYYLGAVPIMAVNPLGTIKKGISNQRWGAMGKMELIAYAIPAMMFSALVPTIATAIALLVNGTFAFGALITGLIGGIIGGIIGSVIVGFIWHPFNKFFIKLLKGESTYKSRSNYAIAFFTATILVAIPTGVGTIVAAIPLPILPALGPLLTLVGTLVMAFLSYSWVKYFKLHKVVLILVMIGAGLSVLGAVANFGWTLYSSVATFLASDGSSGGDSGGDVEIDDITRQAIENAKAAGATAEQIEQMQNAAKLAAQARADAEAATKKAMEDAEAAANGGKADPGDPAAPGDPGDPGMGDKKPDPMGEKKPDPVADTKPDPVADTKPDPVADTKPDPVPVRTPPRPAVRPTPPANVGGATPFATFLSKRDAVEEAIKNDPKLLEQRPILREYERLWKKTYDIRDDYKKKKGKRWEKDKIFARQKDAEIYDATRVHVEALYRLIFGG